MFAEPSQKLVKEKKNRQKINLRFTFNGGVLRSKAATLVSLQGLAHTAKCKHK